jgi:hypothetical protein
MPVIYLILNGQNELNMGQNNALKFVVMKGGNPAHWGA